MMPDDAQRNEALELEVEMIEGIFIGNDLDVKRLNDEVSVESIC